MIRYYSAAQEQSAWSRASDAALVLSFFAALPITWLCDVSVTRFETAHHISGTLQLADDEVWHAYVSHPEHGAKDEHVPQDEFFGFFAVSVERLAHGFPLTTSQITHAPRIDLTPIPARQSDPMPERSAGSPLHKAVADAVARSNLADARAITAALSRSGAETERHYWAWLAASLFWWVALFVAVSVLVLFARLGTILFLHNRAARMAALVAHGRCPYCAYDLRGLDFSERCPECGNVQG